MLKTLVLTGFQVRARLLEQYKNDRDRNYVNGLDERFNNNSMYRVYICRDRIVETEQLTY